MCHNSTDIWGDTAPQDEKVTSTLWPMGAAWLCLHIFEHYEYTLDIEFLNEHFDAMCEAAEFLLNILQRIKAADLLQGLPYLLKILMLQQTEQREVFVWVRQ